MRVPLAIFMSLHLGSVSGCVRVPPHERDTLARRDMERGAGAELRAGEVHARAYREGSIGGAEARSGGCGCN